jgi:class 3 adenylate cyclase/tetratricopeptide (TPR) repeat protein
MTDVFISYARSTAKQADAMAEALRAVGYSVWLDDDLPAHRTYSHVIEEQLDGAKAALVVWSADAARSEWVLSEANRARESRKLVQVAVDDIRLPMPFDQIQCANLAGWSGDADAPGWRKAIASIAEILDKAPTPRRPPADVLQPEPPPPPRLAPGGERRHLAVLFCDIVSSTEIAAQRDPEEWHAIASQYQRAATQAVTPLGGHVSKYLGDGLIVYFGYPQAQEDAAERAVRAGLAILETMSTLNARLAQEHQVELQVRVGIHSGTVVVAQGEGEDAEIFGDAPNIASRVQDLAAPDTVVITAAVHALVPGLFELEDRGETPLRGAPAPVRLHRVIRPSEGGRPGRGSSRRELTAFVGREEEMQLLLGRWKRVREGEGQCVLLVGEPGIGKSRLMGEFRAGISEEASAMVQCAGAPFLANTPFHAVTQMLDQILGRGDGPEARLARLEAALEAAGVKTAEAVPLIAEMLDLPVPPSYPPPVFGPEQRRPRLLAALAGWVLGAARSEPLLMVVEDLHWVDPSTLELLQILAEQGATASLMLLCTARPEFRAPWAMRAHHTQITLNRLNSRQTRELVTAVMSRAGLAGDVVDAVIERTDGVPLFAEELTRLMLEREGHTGAQEIPATLLDSLAARLDRLGRAKEVAQMGAVLGREFSYELLRAVWPMPEAELQHNLSVLADAELIYARGAPPDAQYRFKHALVQNAAYEALLKAQRRELHARVARTITEQFASLSEAQPEVLAHHWSEAGEATPAIAAWARAGDGAFTRRAFKEAEAGYRQALASLRTQAQSPDRDGRELELTSALNRVLQLTRGYAAPETVETAARARALAETTGSVTALIREEARIWRGVITAGDYAGAAALADHISELAHGEGHNPARLLFAHNAQVQTRFYTGDLAGVEEQFAQLSVLIDTPGLRQAPGNNVIPIGVASLTAWAGGRARLAHERMARAVALARDSKDPYDLAMTLHFQGLLYSCERDAGRAEDAASQLVTLSDENGFSYAGDLGRGTLGWAMGQRGAFSEGAALLRQAWTALAASGARIGISYGLTELAETLALAGAMDEALAAIEDALTANPQELVFRPDTLRRRGELCLMVGDTTQAEADFRDAISLAQGMGAKAWALRAATSLGRLLKTRGDGKAISGLLGPVFDGPTDGLGAEDIADARLLLDELGA